MNGEIDYKVLLSPENCKSTKKARSFLRYSREISDDSIRQHLNEIDRKDCAEYFKQKILPQWQARASLIQYCQGYSKNLRKEFGPSDDRSQIVAEKASELDLRQDPYALENLKNKLQRQFEQCDSIDNWVRNEDLVENIVKEQTAEVLKEKCIYQDWVREFDKNLKE